MKGAKCYRGIDTMGMIVIEWREGQKGSPDESSCRDR